MGRVDMKHQHFVTTIASTANSQAQARHRTKLYLFERLVVQNPVQAVSVAVGLHGDKQCFRIRYLIAMSKFDNLKLLAQRTLVWAPVYICFTAHIADVQPVGGDSMQPALNPDTSYGLFADWCLVDKLSTRYLPIARGEVVQFR